MRKPKLAFAVVIALFTASVTCFSLSGCSSQLIATPTGQIYASDNLTAKDVKNSIIIACQGRDWQVLDANDHKVTARYRKPGMSVTIEIDFNSTSYTINWKESTGELERKGDTINRHYNRWVNNLKVDIDRQLQTVKMQKLYAD